MRLSKNRTDVPSLPRGQTHPPWTSVRWSISSARESPTVDERTNNHEVCPVESGRQGVAGRKEPPSMIPNKETSSKKRRTIQDLTGGLPDHLSPLTTTNLHNIFHASLLSTYWETMEHGPNFINPSPEEIEGKEEYKIAEILSHRGSPGHQSYLVSWKGYSSAENMWEPEWNLKHTQIVLMSYKQRNSL